MSASKWLRERDAKYRRDGYGPGAAHWQALLEFLDGAFGEATPSTDSERDAALSQLQEQIAANETLRAVNADLVRARASAEERAGNGWRELTADLRAKLQEERAEIARLRERVAGVDAKVEQWREVYERKCQQAKEGRARISELEAQREHLEQGCAEAFVHLQWLERTRRDTALHQLDWLREHEKYMAAKPIEASAAVEPAPSPQEGGNGEA